MRWRWEHRGAGIAITLSKPTAHADGVPADPHEVGYAPGDSQSNAERTESRTLIEPANGGADTPQDRHPEPTAQEPTATRSATKNPSRSPIRVETTTTQTVTAAPSPSTVTRSVTISPSPSASPSPSSSAAGEPAETSGVSWFWWALAGLLLAAAIATPLLVRAHRRRVWRADFATAEQEVAWFARVLVPELGQSGSLDQVEGGWTVGANRIAAVEDQLTVLEASAPDDVTRTGTRTLRDAVRASRGRVEELLQSGDPEAISPTLNEVAAGLEAALGSVDQAG